MSNTPTDCGVGTNWGSEGPGLRVQGMTERDFYEGFLSTSVRWNKVSDKDHLGLIP